MGESIFPGYEHQMVSIGDQRLSVHVGGHCQTNLTEPAKGADLKRSGCKLTPLGQGGRTVLFEDVAAVEVAVEVEMVVD